MKSVKRFAVYFSLTIGFLTLVFWGYKIPLNIKEKLMFNAPLELLTIYSIVLPILIGMILRLPTLIKEIKEKKKWAIDWVKLCAIGIPTLYISQASFLYFYLPSVTLPFSVMLVRNPDMPLTTISGMIFGYIVLDSLKKS
ncbi:hypothetical protein SAMN05216232_3535 [Virgibacillus subterraneus]|uniref:Permease n=1 Tax=Virgibacillus subterraneus TaxID=621109 RepID=A0A1H9JME8_9BACI|nr:hypothetical protein [Virgibacillus subterraneus]SEQ87775.1 hypothetical protein SAMN05216232_3535 [Virgibacillus subterraneus]